MTDLPIEDASFTWTAFVVAGMFLTAFIVVMTILSRFVVVCRPHEVHIFSGRSHRLADGSRVGYRIVTGGWAFRWPFLETVSRMEMTEMPVEVEVRNAYSKGGIPLYVHAIANVKINSDRRYLANAIERFLGRDASEIYRVAKETLEGHLRGIIAGMTPEEVNEDRLKFADHITEEAVPDLHKLGLHLDTIKVLNVSDETGYLDAIGRERIAIIKKDAEVAESNALKEAEQAEALARGNAQVERERTATATMQKERELERIRAKLKSEIQAEKERADGAGQAVRAQAEVELQVMRAKVGALRLQADVVIPAEFALRAREQIAAGEAATISAEGEAASAAMRELSAAWAEAGEAAKRIFLVQNADVLLDRVVTAVRRVEVGEVVLVDGGDGNSLPGYVTAYPNLVARVLDEIARTTGVDVLGTIRGDDAPPASRPSRG